MDADHAELRRLEALASFEVMDTPPEPLLDWVAEMAAKLFDVPTALISLIDADRQWFKANVGLDAESTSRDEAFCAQALKLPPHSVLVVEDARVHPMFKDYAAVTSDPFVRFYAGALLTDSEGNNLGTLCVLSPEPRPHPTGQELERLQTLANLVVDHLESRRRERQLERRDAELAQLNRDLESRVIERTQELEKQHAELSAGKARLDDLIANAHQAIVVMDEDGRIEGWNRQAQLTFGWTAEEAIGQTLAGMIIPPAFRDQHEAGMKRFLATGSGTVIGQRIEVPALHREGHEILVELAISAIKGPTGWCFTGLLHDITERRAQEEVLENAFRHAPIGFLLVGLDGRLMRANDAFASIIGYNLEELKDITFQQITHIDDLDRDLELLGDLTAGRIASYQMDKRYIRKDGRAVWVNLSVSLVRRHNGEPKHYIAQVQDLSDRMEAEARYQLIAERATDMIVTSDLSGRTTFVSAGCRALTGWTQAEALGRRVEEYVHVDDLDMVQKAFGDIARGGPPKRIRWRGWNRERNEWMWLESSPALLTEGHDLCFVDVVRDINAQVAQEEALAAAREAAEAAVAAKTEFLANMSHEIRTPLTAVIGFAGLLKAQADLSPMSRRFAERIGVGAGALLSVVNSILDFSKLEAGEIELHPAPTNATTLAQEILALFQPQADTVGLDLRFEADPIVPESVRIDPQAIRQVLLNLIGNAIKFTESGSVTVAVTYHTGRLRVDVRDTGPGIPTEHQPRLFERFSQIDGSTTRRHGGTGLGLAISRSLIHAMGGEIGVDSELGIGSTFWFETPAPDSAIAPELTGDGDEGLFEGIRILLADEDAAHRALALRMLQSLGCEVQVAEDSDKAIEAAQLWPVDLILLDRGMTAAIQAIRTQPGPNIDVLILAFTADGDAPAGGFNGAAPKPLSRAGLIESLQNALQLPGDSLIASAG